MIGENLNDEFGLGFWISDDTINKTKKKGKIDPKKLCNEIVSLVDEECDQDDYFVQLKSKLYDISEYYEKKQ